jgi:transcriptional regulator with XRE-family HTH domain
VHVDVEEFGHRLRTNRAKLWLTGREVADQCDLSPAYYSKLERGEVAPPSTPKILKLAEVLDLDADSLLATIGRLRPERWRTFWSAVATTQGLTGLSDPDQERFIRVQLAAIKDE